RSLWHDADHGGRCAVDAYRSAHYSPICAVSSLPESMAEDRDGRCALSLVGGREVAPDGRPLAKQPKCIGTDQGCRVALRIASLVSKGDSLISDDTQILERLSAVPPVDEVRIGHAASPPVLLRPDVKQAIVVFDRTEPPEE